MEANELKITKKGTTPQERQAIIDRWKESGISKKEFCSAKGINYYTLMSWLTPSKNRSKQLKPGVTKEQFSEVKLPEKLPGDVFARISFGKAQVDFYQPVSADFLKRLLSA